MDKERQELNPKNSPFEFVPFAQQKGEIKLHVIDLNIDFPAPSNEEINCPHCNSLLQNKSIDYKFGWGKKERLECVVKDTPALNCQTCDENFLDTPVAWPIKVKAKIIDHAFEFQTREDFKKASEFLPSQDMAKLRDFTKAVQEEADRINKGQRPIPKHTKSS